MNDKPIAPSKASEVTDVIARDALPRSTQSLNERVLPQAGQMLGDLAIPNRARWSLRVIWLGMFVLVAWASVAKIDQVTRAPAQLIATARTQLIQSADGGIVTQLHIKEGEEVKEGQLLATLQKERAAAAAADSAGKVAALRITLLRLQAEVFEKPLVISADLRNYTEYIRNQTDLYNKRRRAFQEDISALKNILQLADSELSINKKLEATGDVSQAEILRLERAVADLKAQLANKQNKYFQDVQTEMTKVQEDLNTQTEQLRDRTQLLEHTELVAPMNGIVNVIKVNTVGGVVRSGETVIELLPTGGELIAEAKISNADIAFVNVGQDANVKLDAYDSSIFGSMQGIVSYISSDVLTEETRNGQMQYYRVQIKITNTEFKGKQAEKIQLRPGLTAQVDIKAMDRTVLSYLTKPIFKTFSQSLGER